MSCSGLFKLLTAAGFKSPLLGVDLLLPVIWMRSMGITSFKVSLSSVVLRMMYMSVGLASALHDAFAVPTATHLMVIVEAILPHHHFGAWLGEDDRR